MDSSSSSRDVKSNPRMHQKSLLEENQQLKETIRWLEHRLSLEQQQIQRLQESSKSRSSPPPAKWTKRNRHPSDDLQFDSNGVSEDHHCRSPGVAVEEHAGLKHRKSPPSHAATASPKRFLRIPNLNDVLSLKNLGYDDLDHEEDEEGRPFISASSSSNNSKVVSTPETSVATTSFFLDDEVVDTSYSSFVEQVKDRGMWLVGLLLLQSLSSFIIRRNEALLQDHIVIVQFLTMLVGAGGNGGNQASVKVIRGLAVGDIHNGNLKTTILEEISMGFALAMILGCAGALRAAIFSVPFMETLAITMSLVIIVFLSVILGALLPIAMKCVGLDPAHSSTTIQVLMDILGVTITVHSALGIGIVQALARGDPTSTGDHP